MKSYEREKSESKSEGGSEWVSEWVNEGERDKGNCVGDATDVDILILK